MDDKYYTLADCGGGMIEDRRKNINIQQSKSQQQLSKCGWQKTHLSNGIGSLLDRKDRTANKDAGKLEMFNK